MKTKLQNNATKWQGYTYKQLVERKQAIELEMTISQEQLSGYFKAMTLAKWIFSIYRTISSPKVMDLTDYIMLGLTIMKKFIRLNRSQGKE